MIIVFSINFLLIERVDALSDTKQLVLDAWTLVNEGFYDPDKFEEIQWKRIRQKTLQKQIVTTEEAYSAIEDMLRPLEDPYTRILRPKDYELLKSSNFGSEINGVGLQLGEDDNNKIKEVFIAFGGMAAVPKRAKACEKILKNKPLNLSTFNQAKNSLDKDLSPIGDMRASKEYRLEIAKNLLMKCFVEIDSNKLTRVN